MGGQASELQRQVIHRTSSMEVDAFGEDRYNTQGRGTLIEQLGIRPYRNRQPGEGCWGAGALMTADKSQKSCY